MLDLFSGIGGIALAAHWAGIETAAFVEIDPFCRAVLAKHWPAVPQFEDIRDVTADTLSGIGRIDIVAGGFPCQPFSLAGQRQGARDDRHLWPQMLRIVEDVRPTWVIGENVTGLISMAEQYGDRQLVHRSTQRFADSDHYKAIFTQQEIMLLGIIIDDLYERGYALPEMLDGTPCVFCYPAAGVGAPHERQRVFIVGHATSERSTGERIPVFAGGSQQAGIDVDGTGEVLGDTQRRGLPGGDGRGTGQEPANGCEGVADALRGGWRGQPGEQGEGSTARGRIGEDGQVMADADRDGKYGRAGDVQMGRIGEPGEAGEDHPARGDERQLESRLGGNVDGLPSGLVRGRFPARPGEIQYEWEPSRTATGVKHRARQLKAFGNAVMPQQIYPLFAAIVEASA